VAGRRWNAGSKRTRKRTTTFSDEFSSMTSGPRPTLPGPRDSVPAAEAIIDRRVWTICGLCVALGFSAAIIAQLLVRLIAFVTNLAFFGRLSFAECSPADNALGWGVVLVPIGGALIVGLMARYGSKAIRGHGIPEAMEQVLTNQSRIPARIAFLKPTSAAISIGTGGPFGAEGPIIATGAAIGSVLGQILSTTPMERKTLLAAGAAAGMAATFGSPVSAVLLAIELLLFEFRPRSMIPVALASSTAAAVRMSIEGFHPVFPMPVLDQPSGAAMAFYIAFGAVMGVAAMIVTRLVYLIEDGFEKLPIHWMWWPAIGAIAVGVCGYYAPRTLGVGYVNISDMISARLEFPAVVLLCTLKFISWSISLGSGTSGGTLAPLFTLGSGLGAVVATGALQLFPESGVDVRIAALVGMAAMFAGASRALLASVIFAFETTLQPMGLLPLLGGCSAAFLVSCLTMRNSLMTEKIARRGIRTPGEYTPDVLGHVLVGKVASRAVIELRAEDTLASVRAWLKSGADEMSHQGFPVVNAKGILMGVVTRRDLFDEGLDDARVVADAIRRLPLYVYTDCTVRQAVDHMVNHDIGRLPIVGRDRPGKVVGIITRSDILSVYRHELNETRREEPTINVRLPRLGRGDNPPPRNGAPASSDRKLERSPTK
jgi:H+/Cl- antiporter ClcA/CBS domain-containing protein